jgi:FtsP/CotA-like multicopper oxidase with cupredoxin domain
VPFRTPFDVEESAALQPRAESTATFGGPEPWEAGARKDTVIAYPGEIPRVKATYYRVGLFVWHCHIVEHEDHEMMRPTGLPLVQTRRSAGPSVDLHETGCRPKSP